MMLLVDIGNSRIKLGWLDRENGAREVEPLAAAHDQLQTVQPWLRTLPRSPVVAVGVNVAGARVAQRVQDALGLPIAWVRSSACAGGVRNGYATPDQLGADRWLALIGLAGHAAQDLDAALPSATPRIPHMPLMLANYGTATTIDTLAPQDLDGTRRFIGGLILPGVNLMRSALAQHTAQLPLAQGAAAAFPTHTNDAIISGVCAAQAGAVMQQWRRVYVHFGRAPVVYVSGGDWPLVASTVQDAIRQVRTDLALAPDPVRIVASPILDGLAQMGQRIACHDPHER